MNSAAVLRFPSDDEAVNIGYVRDLYVLLRAIDEKMPKDAVLYVEGTSIAGKTKNFLASRPALNTRAVESGGGWPKPKIFHLSLEGTNLGELRELAEHLAEPEVCDTLVVYRGAKVLLWAHDAGYGYVLVSRSFPEKTIEWLRETLVTPQRRLRERVFEAWREAFRPRWR